ncbi:nocturnin isoform X3 [Periplaneta americana]|uniref:nocturnin isoform X3 n=1 Tax=Periplaneta americana TaxID=6978 RepID=UPI0037E980C4
MCSVVCNRTLWTPARTFRRMLRIPRMGSFTSAPKILNEDTQDADVELPERMSRDELLQHCHQQLLNYPSLVKRCFRRLSQQFGDTASGLRVLQWNVLSRVCGEAVSSPYHIRVLQWNVLSQALGQMNDNFVCCPDEALEWRSRRYHMVEELVGYCPDILCLQEVDHFNFLKKVLGSQGYSGMFFPKPDSPCLYIKGNNGPDGCAIFFRDDKFELLKAETRILEVWRVQSNQVAVIMLLRVRETGQEICVATTHLKARNGALLSTLRNEQGKDLLDFVMSHCGGRPVIICGDFNAEPTEPVYLTILSNRVLRLASAYAASGSASSHCDVTESAMREPPYTTWKIREEGEVCHTIDYVFYSQDTFTVEAVLDFPSGEEIGEGRVPSFNYPSDHFSLVCDFRFKNTSAMES